MHTDPIRIGTRESELAVWQATLVKNLLEQNGHKASLIYIKSDGDTDLVTPLYAMGVQGVFTRSLDVALLGNKIDIAVHSMKDVPVQLPQGIQQAAVLKRASHKDILVCNKQMNDNRRAMITDESLLNSPSFQPPFAIATSSIRRKAQWLHRYPGSIFENLRGNVNTRLRKLSESSWDGAIFAAAGLERINLRPEKSIDLNWMLPAPAQGAIMVAARSDNNDRIMAACSPLNDQDTETCVSIERNFLSALMGGCSTPISALAEIKGNRIVFKGNIVSPDGQHKSAIEQEFDKADAATIGQMAAAYILEQGGRTIMENLNSFK